MKVLVLLLLLGLQGCAKATENCVCDYCRELLEGKADYCGNPSIICEAISNVTSLSKCATSSPHTITCTNGPTLVYIAALGTLGALAGLLLVILVLIVTGCMWTFWTRKKKREKTGHCKNYEKQESEEERIKMTTTQPVVGSTIEQPLDSLEESGQSVNGLTSKDNKGYCGVNRAVENIYTSSEGSSHSSLQEEQAVNRVEEGETREKHVYHVLEKPGGDGYEEPHKNLKEDIAMEYETPVPLNEF